MKKIIRPILLSFIIVAIYLIASNFTLIRYGIQQLKGQLTIVSGAIDIDKAIETGHYSIKEIQKLKLIQDIRQFAIDSLGLSDNQNYKKVYNQNSKPLLWIVTACLPFELKPYQWTFPYIGDVSYKGFFIKKLAVLEEQKIYSKGYDTDISTVSAWSTLGFLHDPILSNMLKRSEGHLAELIIHELTHATIYIASDVDYNENLATFIGEEGAKQFILGRYGKKSMEYLSYLKSLEDEKKLGTYMVNSSQQLDSLYNSFTNEISVSEKSLIKYEFIGDIMRNIKHLQLNFPKRYTFDPNKNELPNNTFFMSYLRYRSDQTQLKNEFEYKSESKISDFIELQKLEHSSD